MAIVEYEEFEQFEHHGQLVWVRGILKGRHGDFCLCHRCKLFQPDKYNNCGISMALLRLCGDYNILTAVWRCPQFVEREK